MQDEGLRGDQTLARYGTVDDLARAHIEANRHISKKGLVLPSDGDDAGAVRAAMTQLGCPASPNEYDLGDWQPPEDLPWDPDTTQRMQEKAWQLGLTQKQWPAFLSAYAEEASGAFGKQQDALRSHYEQGMTTLKNEWGHAWEKNLGVARSAVERIFGEDSEAVRLLETGDGNVLGNQAGFISVMHRLGQAMEESGVLPPSGVSANGPAPLTRDEAHRKIAEFNADPEKMKALHDSANPKHAEAQKEWTYLHAQAFNQPAPAGLGAPGQGAFAG